MKNTNNDKWLHDSFARLPQADVSEHWEAKVMEKIAELELQKQQKQQLVEVWTERIVTIGTVLATMVGLAYVWHTSQLHEQVGQLVADMRAIFANLQCNMMVVNCLVIAGVLLAGEHFLVRWLNKRNQS